jgi:hypothetical protein
MAAVAWPGTIMKRLALVFSAIHAFMALLFACAAIALIIIATHMGWVAFAGGINHSAAEVVIEAIGLLATAVVALQISQTVVEEEVIRDAHISAPTRIRRFLSRFLVVIIVALAIEGLVAVFKARDDPDQLVHAASLVLATGALLAGWGAFIRLNCYAEELEPEAMEKAKQEDRKLE